MKLNPKSLSRRSFLRGFGTAVLAGSALPSILPASVFGAGAKVPPGDRVVIGCIGVGERCQEIIRALLNHNNAQVVAVCDVKKDALDRTKALIDGHYQNSDCRTYEDFQQIVARKDIDAFAIASTDHWHVLHALAAVRAGKDIYVEKPLGFTLAEDQVLRAEIKQHRRIFQFGTQQRSDRKFRLACELVRNGHIGKLKNIVVWAHASRPGGSIEVVPPPTTLNYELWTGPAVRRPYTEDLTAWEASRKTWWFNSNYAVGFIAGWGIHPIDIALWGAGDAVHGRLEIEGTGEIPTEGACDTATGWDVNFRCESGLLIRFVGVPNGAPGKEFSQRGELSARYGQIQDHGTAFEGTEGWIHVDRSRINFHPENLIDLDPSSFKVRLTESGNHVGNFLGCIKSRKPTVCPIDAAVLSDAFCHVADIAIRLKRKLAYDTRTEKFLDAPDANRRLALRPMRAPWSVQA